MKKLFAYGGIAASVILVAFGAGAIVIGVNGFNAPFVSSAASGVAVMFCAVISSRTVFNPFTPITIEPIPNATRITLAAIPPYPNHFFITVSSH